jgi:hypothetical protein
LESYTRKQWNLSKGVKMSIFRENPEYLEQEIDSMLEQKEKAVSELVYTAKRIEDDLGKDYGTYGSFDVDGWDTRHDSEIIAYDIGYRNACLNAVKLIKKLTNES